MFAREIHAVIICLVNVNVVVDSDPYIVPLDPLIVTHFNSNFGNFANALTGIAFITAHLNITPGS